MHFNKKFKIIFVITCFLCIVSCSSKTIYTNLSLDDQSINDNSDINDEDMNLLTSYQIPEGFDHSISNDEDTTVYLYKKDDPNGNEGYISISSLNKLDLPLEEMIETYCSYFDEEDDILSYTYEAFVNKNNIQCLKFSLILADYFDDVCYVLIDNRDICIDTIYFSSENNIIDAANEVIDSITN